MPFPTDERPTSTETLLEIAKTEGEQTIISENIKLIAAEIDPSGEKKGVALVKEVCAYVRTLFPRGNELEELYNSDPTKRYDKRARTADELLSEDNLLPNRKRGRNISGCIETAVVTRALLLAKGVPCVYTETLLKDWCDSYGPGYTSDNPYISDMTGHVFIDLYDEANQKWYTADPNDPERTIHEYQDYTKNGKQFIFPKSAKDSWDMGYTKMRDFQRAVSEYFKGTSSSNEIVG